MSKDQDWFVIAFFQGGGSAWGRSEDEFTATETAIKQAKSFAKGFGGFKKDGKCQFNTFCCAGYDEVEWEGFAVYGVAKDGKRVPLELVRKQEVNMTTGKRVSKGLIG